MHLESISADNYKEFVCNHFEAGKRHVESEIIDKVYNNFEGHTGICKFFSTNFIP